jgi:hypothetical protein
MFRQREGIGTVSVPGSHLRRAASDFWSEIGRKDLSKTVDASFTGRDVDKL